MKSAIDLHGPRAKKARLSRLIGRTGFNLLLIITVICLVCIGWLVISKEDHFIYLFAAVIIACYMLAVWWQRDLAVLPPKGDSLEGNLSVDVLSGLKTGQTITPKSLWQSISGHWQVIFLTNHLLLPPNIIINELSNNEQDLEPALTFAFKLAKENKCQTIEPGFIAAGLLSTSPPVKELLIKSKLQPSDISEVAIWIGRLSENMKKRKQSFGGIGRDWAFGFTPMLNRYGDNISLSIAKYGSNFGHLTNSGGVSAVEAAFDNNAGSVALIGPTGIGKTSHVYALAQKLIEGRTKHSLAYNQIVSLDAAALLTNSKEPNDLEYLITALASEAGRAGHIILFLDNSQLFFTEGLGSFNAANVLLPIFQNKRIRIILTFTPEDYQRLKTTSPNLAALITPVVLAEQSETDVMRILEDTAISFENRNKVLIAYEALTESYRLSGRYNQDGAYPGKAIKLLEQSLSNASDNIVTADSVQKTIEQTVGVKVGSAAPVEADNLLHLEDRIHQRMVDQNRAVNVVSSALRRSRAGVSDPHRPIGSFLFLGPTGVGKTELAKSLAAEYFGSEDNLVRLDMSEYQQAEDVKRLLDNGKNESSSLIMSVRRQPFSVVLLDEIEKAHSNVLNLLLQMLDEGKLTDDKGRATSFKDCIIIATSNAGAQEIRERIQKGESLESFEEAFIDQIINSGQFKPELLNRFDEIVLFKPLLPDELFQIVDLMMDQVNKTLSNQNISVELTELAIKEIVKAGYDPRLGARPMRRILQRAVEDTIAQQILQKQILPGDHVRLDAKDLEIPKD
jgi:ATP-dependent Clp protease ATP-binding subunit ClpC